MKTLAISLLLLLVLLLLGGLVTRPAPLQPLTSAIDVGDDPDGYLASVEAEKASQFGLVEGAEKRIVWAAEEGARSDYVVIYLHGFSATRGEIAPVPEKVAAALGANLYETRLAGHGQLRERLADVSAEAWLEDGAEALAVGRALGDRLIVMGVSTGATIALASAQHPDFTAVDSLVLISPNWSPAGGNVDIAVGPYGPQLVRLIAGKRRSWDAANPMQEKYWTTDYPTASVVEMMRLVKLGNSLTTAAKVPNALLIYSPLDDVVSVPALQAGFDDLPAARKETISVDNPDSLSMHVLTGDILAPAETEATVNGIVDFVRRGS